MRTRLAAVLADEWGCTALRRAGSSRVPQGRQSARSFKAENEQHAKREAHHIDFLQAPPVPVNVDTLAASPERLPLLRASDNRLLGCQFAVFK